MTTGTANISPKSHSTDVDATAHEPSRKRQKAWKSTSTDDDLARPNNNLRRKTACQSCRLRKVACDGARPSCGTCEATDSACIFTELSAEKLTLETATELLCGRLAQLQDGMDQLQELARPNHLAPPLDGGTDHGVHDAPIQHSRHDAVSLSEASGDFLQIPAHRTTADMVLVWEIFDGKYPPSALVGAYFARPDSGIAGGSLETDNVISVRDGLQAAEEERIPALVESFLQNVHTKNPILDAVSLVNRSQDIASNGLGWNAWSCLLLFVAALGTLVKPFDAAISVSSPVGVHEGATKWTSGTANTGDELRRAESYFVLGCRRLGCLRHSLLGAQCYFFAGVYMMYTLRPLLSWQYFFQASVQFQLHMKTTYGLHLSGLLPSTDHVRGRDEVTRRLEESMYWSCFKSENEFRVELPLPQSEVATFHHAQMFPSPPSPARCDMPTNGPFASDANTSDVELELHPMRTKSGSSSAGRDDVSLRQRVARLCNEEESWYYYLTEIALRRIGNRIIKTFFENGPSTWLQIQPLIGIALEYDVQLSAWSAHLPTAMRNWEVNYAIRNPTLAFAPEEGGNHVSRELSWALENRLLEARSWLYQPFLYWLTHSGLAARYANHAALITGVATREDFTTMSQGVLGEEDAVALYHFIVSGIACNLKTLDVRSLRHRHHGLWYDMRSTMCASLTLLAVVKSGNAFWIPGGPDVLWGAVSVSQPRDGPLGGKIGHVLEEYRFWAHESPELLRQHEILTEVASNVRDQYLDFMT